MTNDHLGTNEEGEVLANVTHYDNVWNSYGISRQLIKNVGATAAIFFFFLSHLSYNDP